MLTGLTATLMEVTMKKTNFRLALYVMCCAMWDHLHNLKNVKNTHGRMLLLVKLQAKPATLLKVTLLHECFLRFLYCTNGTKSGKTSHNFREFP